MAWQVGIILGSQRTALIRQMPVWALETTQRRAVAQEVWDSTAGFWAPEPAFTLFSAGGAANEVEILRGVLGTVVEHHPRVVTLDVIGTDHTRELEEILREMKFEAAGTSEDGLLFKRPISEIGGIPELIMNASGWMTRDDLFISFFKAVGAPDWHGKNYDALDDSIVDGGINRIEAPYSLRIENYLEMDPAVKPLANEFIEFIRELGRHGCPIQISTESRA